MSPLRALLLVFACAAAACQRPGTYVVLSLEGDAVGVQVTALTLTATDDKGRIAKASVAGPFTLPQTVSLALADEQTTFQLEGTALFDDQASRTAQTSVSVLPGTTAQARLSFVCDRGSSTPTSCGGACVDLTSDATNCGRCGVACGGTQCVSSQCVPRLLTSKVQMQGIAVDGPWVYYSAWIDYTKYVGEVGRLPVGGGQVQLLAAGLYEPGPLLVDRGSLYWASPDGHVFRAPTSGGTVASTSLGTGPPYAFGVAIAPADNLLYVASYQTPPGIYALRSDFASDPPDGGAPPDGGLTPVSTAMGTTLVAVDATDVYFTVQAVGGNCPVSNGTGVWRLSRAGGSPTLLAPTASAWGLAIDADNVYFGDKCAGTVSRLAKSGGAATVLASNQGEVRGLALDTQYVYWASFGKGVVARAPVTGMGQPSVIAQNQLQPLFVAVDDKNVYWTNAGDGTLMQVAKP